MIRTKYVEERFPRYFIFGTSAASVAAGGCSSVTNRNSSVNIRQ